ncbi:MAG: hypothetical protein AB8B65_11855, partial [Kordia sp.]|uniref:hypothetical protein n=1 Tax=Kordia sp. TaxID=1965332 RepID=UPI00385D1131
IPSLFSEGSCPDIQKPIEQAEIDHVSDLVSEHIRHTKRKGAEKQYFELNNIILKQLNNPFYDEVNLCVNLTIEENNQETKQSQPLDGNQTGNLSGVFGNGSDSQSLITNTYTSSLKKNDKPCDITLDIKIDASGKVSVKHKANPNYLKKYESKRDKEIKARGLKGVSINDLRQQVIDDFESAEVEHGFLARFIQGAKAFFNENIGAYIEAIQATQKVVVHVWDEGKINEGMWHSTGEDKKEYDKFPSYMHLNPTIGGVTDGVIDEILSIPMAIKSIYGIATDEKQREALGKLFTKEGFNQMIQSLSSEVDKIKNDPELLQHFSGKTTISVAAMVFGVGVVIKLGKLEEVLDVATDGLKKITNSKVLGVLEDLRKANRYKPEILKAIEDFIKKIDTKVLDKLADAPGFDQVLKDMAQHWKKFHGGKFALQFASEQIKNGKILKFEVSDLSNDLRRIYDVVIDEGNNVLRKLELKSWKGFYPDSIKKQFTKDLVKMDELGDIQWIFNKKGVNQTLSELKENVMKSLKKADGTPIDELNIITVDQVKKLFPEKKDLDALNEFIDIGGSHQQFLLDKLNEDVIFDKIFEIVDVIE